MMVVAAALAAEPAAPPAIVLWAQPEVPDEEIRKKAERLTGPAKHLAWADVALDLSPWSSEDEARLGALKQAATSARGKWDLFDVELGLARELDAACDNVQAVRDEADRKLLVDALLLQASAALRVVPESRFAAAEELASLRQQVGGRPVAQALVDVLALEPERAWTRADVPDALTLTKLEALREDLRGQPRATLLVDPLPAGAVLVVDGRPQATVPRELGLEPGHHYVHVLADGKIAARKELDLEPGGKASFAPFLTKDEVATARKAVVAGSREVGGDFIRAAEAAGRRTNPPSRTFVAAVDDEGTHRVLAWANGAQLVKRRVVTAVLAGDLGGGVIVSPAFAGEREDVTTAAAFGGDLSFELGITYAVLYGGASLSLTPSYRMKWNNTGELPNAESPVYVRPYGGVGLYLPRPRKDQPLLMIGGNYGWMSPGAMGPGARIAFGVPMSGDGTWLRFDLDGFAGTQQEGFPGEFEQTWMAAFRIGFGRLL
ncbi:MAG: hypothetical protein ACOZNI_02870 [Myxococcota bacterium]